VTPKLDQFPSSHWPHSYLGDQSPGESEGTGQMTHAHQPGCPKSLDSVSEYLESPAGAPAPNPLRMRVQLPDQPKIPFDPRAA
jgi:hypothetical protein